MKFSFFSNSFFILPSEMAEYQNLSFFKFNVLSSEEIVGNSVCEVRETKTPFGENCVYDERMGLTEISSTKTCLTCKQSFLTCPGHFGHINLATPILHPMLIEEIVTFLRVICIDCYRPILSAEHLKILRVCRKKGNYKVISQIAKKKPICSNCMHNQPTFVISEGKVYYFYKDKSNRIEMTTAEIYKIFSSIRQSDLKVLGIEKSEHPCNMIMNVIPVCPPCTRPYISMDGRIYDDDITLKYTEIIKMNKLIQKEKLDAKKKVLVNILEFHVATLFDNSKGRSRQINGRPLKGIRERINGKSGRIRNNLMGKRVDFCARTVIGADPTLELNEVGFPEEFAANLTIPETVNRLNYAYLMDLIRQGKVNCVIRGEKFYNMKYVGTQKQYEKSPLDKILITSKKMVNGEEEISYRWVTVDEWEIVNRKPFVIKKSDRVWKSDGSFVEGVEENQVRHFDLRLGDVVERQLRNGDRVILNRQPTLHKGSMLCPKIKILKGRTLRLPISICSAYNADFDGDMFSCLQQ